MSTQNTPPKKRRRRWMIVALVLLFVSVSLCMSLALVFNARRSTGTELMPVAEWLCGVWVILGVLAISFQCFEYLEIVLISQALSLLLCLGTENLSDPDWHIIVGIFCVFMTAGIVTGVGYSLFNRRRMSRHDVVSPESLPE